MIVRKIPKTKKGAKGISLFIPNLRVLRERITRTTPTIAPDQKATTKAESAPDSPSSQLIGTANLASPSPIHRPPETSQSKANGDATNIPDKNSKIDGK